MVQLRRSVALAFMHEKNIELKIDPSYNADDPDNGIKGLEYFSHYLISMDNLLDFVSDKVMRYGPLIEALQKAASAKAKVSVYLSRSYKIEPGAVYIDIGDTNTHIALWLLYGVATD